MLVSQACTKNLGGNMLACHHFPQFDLYDVTVTPDEQYMLGVAAPTEPPDGLQPHKARKETHIIGMSDSKSWPTFFSILNTYSELQTSVQYGREGY